MKLHKFFLIVSLILSSSFVKANGGESRGLDLGECAFGIPIEQLDFSAQTPFTLSFWINIKEFKHEGKGTQFINIRKPDGNLIYCDWGYIHSTIGEAYDIYGDKIGDDMISLYTYEKGASARTIFKHVKEYEVCINEWFFVSFTYNYNKPEIALYINGELILEFESIFNYATSLESSIWFNDAIIMIGGAAYSRSSLNAYVDKVQFYNKALSSEEVKESMATPLLNEESLLGYWDFEEGCYIDNDGYMSAENGTIKSALYKIITSNGFSVGAEIQPFTFGQGVDPEYVLQGVEENVAEGTNTKVFVSNGILKVENTEGIKSVEVYDIMGRVITYVNAKGVTSTQIALPSTSKGVLIVKVNSEILKVAI